MYYVRVMNGQITEGPRNDIPELTNGLIAKGWLPCNYSNYRVGLDEIGTPIIYSDKVEYPITSISESILFEILLANAKKTKEVELRIVGSRLMLQVVTPYTAEERDTWPSQVTEAKAYIADNNVVTPMLSALVTSRGNTVLDQATRILNSEMQFKMAVGTILGIQQHKIDLVNIATTVDEVNSIVWEA